jgi:hypothetical protein
MAGPSAARRLVSAWRRSREEAPGDEAPADPARVLEQVQERLRDQLEEQLKEQLQELDEQNRELRALERQDRRAAQAPAQATSQASARGTAPVASAVPPQVSWGELGCPREIGGYRLGREIVRVKKIHILAAEDEPHALFTVVTFHPPLGPPEHMLGHRVA